MTWEQTAEVLAKEVDRLQKENDRLRDEYQALYKRHDENLGAKYAIARARHIYCRLRDGVQRNVELISEDIDKEWFPLLSKVQQNLLELLSPAAEGGAAANGGESQALQAAILGLHTLAGEFPTPTWKTREDYLQATISEINEILGKQ